MQRDALAAGAAVNNNARAYPATVNALSDMRKEFGNAVAAGGEFQILQHKLVSQSEQYAESLKNGKVGLADAIKNRHLFNQVLREQIALQNSQSLAWTKDSTGRISSDLIIPKNLPADLITLRQRAGLWNTMVQSISANTINWGKNTQWAGRQLMTGLSLPLGLIAAATMKFAYDIDKELTAVVKVYGDVTTGFVESQKNIRANAMSTVKAVAAMYGQSAKDTLGLMAAFAAAGKVGNELQQTTVETSKIALAGELSWQDASAATITLQSVYHHNAQQIGDDYAYINAMENQTVLTSKDFLTAIPKVVGVMNAMGASLQDVGTLLTAMKAGGIDAANGANALKTIDFRLLATYTRGLKTFKAETGQDLKELVASTNGEIIPTLMKFGGAIKDLSKVQQIAVVKDVFGIYQGSKVFTVLQQLMTNSAQMQQAFAVANNTADQNRAIMKQELETIAKSDYQKIKSAWESIQITMSEIGAKILPVGAQVVAWIGRLIKSFASLDDSTKNWVMGFGAVIGLAGPIIMFTGLMANLIGNIVRVGSALSSLVLKFTITDAAQRTQILQGKAAASIWDLQTAAITKMTMSLENYIAIQHARFLELNPAIANPLWATGAAANNPGTPRPARITNPSYVPLSSGIVPTPAMGAVTQDSASGRYRVGGAFATEAQAVKATQARLDANYGIVRAQELQTQTLARNAVQERGLQQAEAYRIDAIVTQNKLLAQQAAEKAASIRSQTQFIGGGLLAAGMVGTMITSTDSLIGKLSSVALMIGMVSMMMPNLLSGMAKGFIGYGKAIGSFISAGWMQSSFGTGAASLVSKAKSGIGTLISGLRAAGPAIAVLAAGVYLYWNAVNDAEEKARKQAEDFAKTTQTMAEVLSFSYQRASPQSKVAAQNKATLADLNAADFAKRNPGAASTYANMFSVKDGQTTGEMWAEAAAAAAQAKLHGASVQAAQDAAFTVLRLMGSKISEAEFSVHIKGLIDFNDTKAVNETILQGISSSLDRSVRDAGTGLEQFNRNFFQGTQNLTQAAGVAASAAADQFSEVYMTTAEADKSALLDRQVAILNAPYDRVVAQMPAKMKAMGINSGAEFSKALSLQGGTFKGGAAGWLESFGFDKATVDSILKTSDSLSVYTHELALNAHQSDAVVAAARRLEDARGFLKPQIYISAATALSQYNRVVAFATMLGHPFNDAQKLAAMNVQRLAEGLPPATNLMEGFAAATTGAAGAATSAATATETLATALKHYGISATADEAIASQKSLITGAISNVSSVATAGLDALATARLDAVQASGQKVLDALDKQSEMLDTKQQAQSDAQTARQDKAKVSFTAYWDARKKAIKNAIKAEQDAEDIRQKIFDAEKTRIQRMSELYSKNIDFNMAINSGSLDEAAKIQNDIISTQQTWAAGDAAAGSQTASEKRVTALNAQLDALTAVEDAQQKSLETRQKSEDKLLKTVQDNAKKKIDAEKKAQAEINKDNEKAVQARSATQKAGFAQDLAVLMAFVPATKAQMAKQIADIQVLYKKYGDGTLVPQGKTWASIIATALQTAIDTTRNETASSKAWAKAGTDIVNSLLKGGFNMTPAQFAAWLNGGPLPKGAFVKPAAPMKTPISVSPANKATGGPIHGPGTGTSDSVPIWASHGEYMINAKQAAKHRPLLDAINYAKGYATGGPISGLAVAPLMGMYGAAKNIFNDVINAAAMHGPAEAPITLSGGKSQPLGLGGLTGGGVLSTVAGMMWPSMWAWIHSKFPSLQMTSNYRPGGTSYHGKGTAIDMAPPSMAVFNAIRAGFGKSIAELIYSPAGAAAIKDGKAVGMGFYGPSVAASHYNHVHWAMPPGYMGGGNLPFTGGPSTSNANSALGKRMAASRGWTGANWSALNSLWTGESGWNQFAKNPSSGAYGIPQSLPANKMASAGADYLTNPATQITWGENYITSRYGSPSAAYAQWLARSPHWYKAGGPIMPQLKTGGYTLNDGYAQLHKRETVLTAPLSDKLRIGIDQLAKDGGVSYTIKADFNGAHFATDVDVERVFEKLMNKAELKNGPKRMMGDRR